MIDYNAIIDAQEMVVKHWGDAGRRVIEESAKIAPFNGVLDDFLNHCIVFGGDWGGMFLSGIKELFPTVWDAIPEDMGHFAFATICATLILCGVDCE